MIHIGEIWIHNEQEVHLARQWTQKLADLVELSVGDHARLTTGVSQVAQSLHAYCQQVRVSFDIHEEAGAQWLRVTLRESDQQVSSQQHRRQPVLSRPDLLKWLRSTRMLVTRFSIRAQDGRPIEIALAKPVPTWMDAVTEQDASVWREALDSETPGSLLDEILQQNQELRRVLDALREKERALEQKIVEIQKLEKLRDDLVHALIHDLRNPLATIRSSLSGLLYNETQNLSSYQSAMIEISYLGVRQMSQLVENVLQVHKLERGAVPLVKKPFSVSALVTDVLKVQSPLALENNIRLTRRIAQDIPPVEGDRGLVERVVQNLVDNALKFTPAGGRVTILAKRIDAQRFTEKDVSHLSQGCFVAISVRDTGTGIPAEIETHLFEKFATGLHEGSGSGLGLAFCRMAVQAHGGEIWAKNNRGPGATFTFILPLLSTSRDGNDG